MVFLCTTMKTTENGRREPDTAPRSRSIWKDVDRKSIEQQIQFLYRKHHVAGRVSYTETSTSAVDENYPIPFELERSLADDFAFIAAYQPQVGYVTAAVVEQRVGETALKVKLAANEGICPAVRRSFDGIMELLTKRATRGMASAYVPQAFGEAHKMTKVYRDKAVRQRFLI